MPSDTHSITADYITQWFALRLGWQRDWNARTQGPF